MSRSPFGFWVPINEAPPESYLSIWGDEIPTVINANDPGGVTLGFRFRTSETITIYGIRFYKSTPNIGTHTGLLWSNGGSELTRVIFTNESASGWQNQLFSVPFVPDINTTYIAGYHTEVGYYSLNTLYFNSARNSPPITALADNTDGRNGVYKYGSSPTFPNETFNAAFYWIDILYSLGV